MTKTKQKSIMLVLVSLLLMLVVAFGFGFMRAGAESPVIEYEEGIGFKTSYDFGTKLEIPAAKLKVGNNSADAESIVIFPDGASYVNNNVTLSQEGRYTVRYRATVGGKFYQADDHFSVNKGLYTVSKNSSSVGWGTYDASEHNHTYPGTTGKLTGLQVALAQGDTFEYNKVINLNDYDEINPFTVKLAVTPDRINEEEVLSVDVVLTDAYDPTNKVTVNVIHYEPSATLGVYNQCYMRAKFEGQQLTGWEGTTKKHVNNAYGRPCKMTFSGRLAPASNAVTIGFDYATKQVHAINNGFGASTYVCDLDSAQDFSAAWEGFTTGECFVSISSPNYISNMFNFVVLNVGGPLSENSSMDERTVTFNVDTGDYSEDDLPFAVVGKPYKLFDATCTSPYFGEMEVFSRVFYNYGGSNCYEIDCSTGSFTPDTLGIYTIAYESKDIYGQVVSKRFNIEAYPDTYLPVSVDMSGCTNPNSGIAGHLLTLQLPQAVGGSGNGIITAFAEIDETSTEIIGNQFRPTKPGNYNIKFVATDYCERTAQQSIQVNVTAGDAPVFVNDVLLPRYFVADCPYMLPVLNANNFTDGSGAEVVSDIYVKDDTDADFYKLDSNEYIPNVRNNGTDVVVKYVAEINGHIAEKSYNVTTVKLNIDDLDITNLFHKKGSVTNLMANKAGTVATFSNAGSLDVVNPVIADRLALQFNLSERLGNFTITLTDYLNPDIEIKATYLNDSGATKFIVTGAAEAAELDNTTFKSSTFNFMFDLEKLAAVCDATTGQAMVVTKTVKGEKFEGFPSGKVYVTLGVENVASGNNFLNPATATLIKIGAQPLKSAKHEYTEPSMYIAGAYGGTHALGDVVKLPAAVVADVIDPSVTISLTVRTSSGAIAYSKDGVKLEDVDAGVDYYLDITEYGGYNVSYTSEDSSGNKLMFPYRINVPDTEKPVITLNGKVATKIKLGGKLVAPEATATDNVTQTDKLPVTIEVITSGGNPVILKGREFVPLYTGKYILRYVCYDEAGNMTVLDFTVIVIE